jgi:hypothetical protein
MFMEFLQQLNFFVWKKTDLSEFYLATIFALFLFRLFDVLIVQIARWVIAALSVVLNYSIPDGQVWYVLIFVTLLIVMFLRGFLIKPLGIKIDKSNNSSLEYWLTAIAVVGFFLYVVNNSFTTVPMPTSLPQWLIRLAYGFENTFNAQTVNAASKSFWGIIPWLWILAPILCFYYPLLKFGLKPPEVKK